MSRSSIPHTFLHREGSVRCTAELVHTMIICTSVNPLLFARFFEAANFDGVSLLEKDETVGSPVLSRHSLFSYRGTDFFVCLPLVASCQHHGGVRFFSNSSLGFRFPFFLH